MTDRPLYSWVDGKLEPWIHYIPVNRDLSDLDDKIKWADTNPERVKVIIENMTKLSPTRKDAVEHVRKIIEIHGMANS